MTSSPWRPSDDEGGLDLPLGRAHGDAPDLLDRPAHRRRISPDDVRRVVETGETIATYPDDAPYPSRLVLGWPGARPLHVVVADNAADQERVIITVHEPDPALWDETFRRRREPT